MSRLRPWFGMQMLGQLARALLPGRLQQDQATLEHAVHPALRGCGRGRCPRTPWGLVLTHAPLELWNLINPVNHATTPAQVDHYKVEPYVVCGDVYGAPPHTGRGGWTWYTGSAGWLYRVALEAILGLRPAGDTLHLEPCVPAGWPGYEITYRHRSATYRIRVENPVGAGRRVRSVTVDGQPEPDGKVPLQDDGQAHDVRVVLG